MSDQKDIQVKGENIEDIQHSVEASQDISNNGQNISELKESSVKARLIKEKNNEDVDAEQLSNINWNNVNDGIKKQKTAIKSKDTNRKAENAKFEFFDELSQRFVEQQDQVIKHRKRLLKWFAWITASQLLIINVLIFICIFGNEQIIDQTLSFMKFFVGATFLELLGGLLIIVKFVFSHETSDMLKHLTYVEPPSKI